MTKESIRTDFEKETGHDFWNAKDNYDPDFIDYLIKELIKKEEEQKEFRNNLMKIFIKSIYD